MPLAKADEQPEQIRRLLTRPDTLDVLRLIANAPNIFESWAQMAGQLFESPTFTPRMREVIILRVAHLQDSLYELAQHVAFARAAGLSDQQIDAIQNKADLGAAKFSGDERTVIDTVTELCTTRRLSEDSFATAHALLGDEALTELLMIVSCYYGLALVLNAVDLEIDTPK
jgi:4-carboxymuconolactone decarboxylase